MKKWELPIYKPDQYQVDPDLAFSLLLPLGVKLSNTPGPNSDPVEPLMFNDLAPSINLGYKDEQ
jgi:hypothetical protein